MNASVTPAAPEGGRSMAPSITAQSAERRSRPRRMSVTGLIGLFIVGFWLVMAVAGPSVAPHSANDLISDESFGALSAAYPLGTD